MARLYSRRSIQSAFAAGPKSLGARVAGLGGAGRILRLGALVRRADLACVDAAVEAGADMVGFILAAESPRRADSVLAAPDTVLRVAVFVGKAEASEADIVQLYERENGHRSRDAVLLHRGERVGTVVDLPWAESDPTHLERARRTRGRVMLAGGLDADNVGAAVAAVRPWAVDSARSTEQSAGVKDHDALRAWVEAAR